MLNVRFIVKMLGVMFILETFFMLAATVVAFLIGGVMYIRFLFQAESYSGPVFCSTLWALRRMNTRPAGGKEC